MKPYVNWTCVCGHAWECHVEGRVTLGPGSTAFVCAGEGGGPDSPGCRCPSFFDVIEDALKEDDIEFHLGVRCGCGH